MLVTENQHLKVHSFLVLEQKLLSIHSHGLFHRTICVSGEAHIGFFSIRLVQAAGENSTHVISQTVLSGALPVAVSRGSS